MHIKRISTRLAPALVATALAAATVASFGLLAAPADAATGFAACPSSAGCLWKGFDYTGGRGDFYGDNPSLGTYGWNDIAKGAGSHGTSGRYFCIYEHAGYSGMRIAFAPGYGLHNLASMNLKTSSDRWLWSNGC